ncbi:excalibur calcium-binding domain-containing protein [Deinococcus arboris]
MRCLSAVLLILSLASAATAAGPIPVGGFKNCTAAKAAGYWNIKKGSPAYHTRLDRDGDGLACEKK